MPRPIRFIESTNQIRAVTTASEQEALAKLETFYQTHSKGYQDLLAAAQRKGLTNLTKESPKPKSSHFSERNPLATHLSMMALYQLRSDRLNTALAYQRAVLEIS